MAGPERPPAGQGLDGGAKVAAGGLGGWTRGRGGHRRKGAEGSAGAHLSSLSLYSAKVNFSVQCTRSCPKCRASGRLFTADSLMAFLITDVDHLFAFSDSSNQANGLEHFTGGRREASCIL